RDVVHLDEAEQEEEGEPVPKRRSRTRRQLTLTAAFAATRIEARGTLRWHSSRQVGRALPALHDPSYAFTASRFPNVSSAPEASTTMVSPSAKSPSSTRRASGSSTRRWMVRLSGLAP